MLVLGGEVRVQANIAAVAVQLGLSLRRLVRGSRLQLASGERGPVASMQHAVIDRIRRAVL